MMLGQRKLQIKSASQKYNALMDLEKDLSKKMFAVKHAKEAKGFLIIWIVQSNC